MPYYELIQRREKLRRVLCTVLAVACLSVCGATQTEPPKPGENTLSLDERLGTDDGAALAILFGANMRGNLDLCDCNYPRGGMVRRRVQLGGVNKKLKKKPVLPIYSGVFLFWRPR